MTFNKNLKKKQNMTKFKIRFKERFKGQNNGSFKVRHFSLLQNIKLFEMCELNRNFLTNVSTSLLT